MKHVAFTCMFVLGLAPGLAAAASVFDGTWKQNAGSAKMTGKPISMLVKDGVFTCVSCIVPYHVKADGTDQPVAGQVSFDTVSVHVVDARSLVETHKLKGQLVERETVSLGTGDGVANSAWTSMQNGTTSSGTTNLLRAGPAPAGAHALSGEWKLVSIAGVSDNAMLMTFKLDRGVLTFSSPQGLSYSARLGGPATPFHGDPHVQTVSVKSLGPAKIIETDMRAGKPVTTVAMTVMPDKKAMTIVYTNTLSGRVASFTATKQ